MQCVNDQFKAFVISVGHAKPYGITNFAVILVNALAGYIVIMVFKCPVYGFPICKVINEALIFIVTMFLWCKKVDEKQKQKIDWKKYKAEICPFLWDA